MKRKDENIDQLFKDAFAGDTFEYQDAYWQNAKQLIQQSKPKAWYLKPSAIAYTVASTIALFGIGISIALFSGLDTNDTEQSSSGINKTSSTSPNSSFEPKTTNAFIITEIKSPQQKNSETKNATLSIVKSNPENSGNPTSNSSLIEKRESDLFRKSTLLHTKTTIPNHSNTKNTEVSRKPNSSSISMVTLAITQTKKTSFNSGNPNSLVNSSSTPYSFQSNTSENIESREQVALLHLSTISLLDLFQESPIEEIQNKENTIPKKRSFRPITLRLSVGNMWNANKYFFMDGRELKAQNQNIELSAEYYFHKQWGLQVGLSFNQVLESQSYTEDQLIDNSYWGLTDNSFWDYQNTPVVVSDSAWWLGGWWYYPSYNDSILDSNYVTQFDSVLVPNTDTTTATINAEHRIKIIELPIMITYNFWIKRWSIQLATGASIGIYSNSKGHIIKNGDPTIAVLSDPTFFKSVQYNYLLSTEVGYSVTEHWQISIRPQMKMNLNSIYQKNSGFSQKFIYYGVNAGLVYRF